MVFAGVISSSTRPCPCRCEIPTSGPARGTPGSTGSIQHRHLFSNPTVQQNKHYSRHPCDRPVTVSHNIPFRERCIRMNKSQPFLAPCRSPCSDASLFCSCRRNHFQTASPALTPAANSAVSASLGGTHIYPGRPITLPLLTSSSQHT